MPAKPADAGRYVFNNICHTRNLMNRMEKIYALMFL